jgi:hypothetical protein
MSRIRLVRRASVVGTAAVAAVVVSAASASAHHCYVPMYSLNGPQSDVWEVYTAESGAADIVGYTAPCEGAVEAGYDALEAAGLPVGIKIKVSKTIGDPKEEGKMNPNGADGRGLEYFGAGSTLADDVLGTWIGAASAATC